MKGMMMLAGFVLYSLLGTIGSGLVMIALTRNSYGGIFIVFASPVIGGLCGLLGIRAGYLVYEKEYASAANFTILTMIAVAAVAIPLSA